MRFVWLLFCVVLAQSDAYASTIAMRAQVDAQKIGLDDTVQLTLTIAGASGALRDITIPLQNLKIVQGPFSSTQISVVNGSFSQQSTHTYVLKAQSEGTATIGAIQVGDKTTSPISIEVVAGKIRSQEPVRPEDPFARLLGRRGQPVRPAQPPKLFVEAIASRSNVYPGEPILITYYLVTQMQGTVQIRLSDAPQYPGFWFEKLTNPVPKEEPVMVENESYKRFAVIQNLLYPIKAGQLVIPKATLAITLQQANPFLGGGDTAVTRDTKPITITVNPLPAATLFSGAVGQFHVSAGVDRPLVSLGEAVTLKFVVRGKGNLKWIQEAPLLELPNAKIYPPQVKHNLQVKPTGIEGSKTWEYVVIPETSGETLLPQLSFSYFDPTEKRMITRKTVAIPVQVEGGSASLSPERKIRANVPARADSSPILRSTNTIFLQYVPMLSARSMAILLCLVLMAHAILWGASHRPWRTRSLRYGGLKPKRSVSSALSDLSRAGKNDITKEAAVQIIEKTVHDIFGSVDEMVEDSLSEGEKLARALLQEVQFIRYAPQLGDYSDKIRGLAVRATDLVRRWG